jgi:phage regulator Rha-like protein
MSSNLISLSVVDGEPRVDTRLIAAGFGVLPKNTRELVDKYSNDFQSFGSLPFQTEVKKRAIGATQERFYLLNEDQCYFLLTLTRNTKPVVELKKRLVLAFADYRKAQAKPAPKLRCLSRKHYLILRSEVDEVAKWTAQPGRAKAAVWEHLRKIGQVENVRYFPPAKMTEALSVLANLKKRTRAFVNDSKASERVFIDTVLSGSTWFTAPSRQPAFQLAQEAA